MGDREMKRQQPRGVPGVSYLRVMTDGNSVNATNVEVDANIVTILSDSEPRARFDRNQFVLERGLTDEEVCEHTIGVQAGSNAGAALNPINAFVADAATTLIVLSGSKQTKKWQFLKKTFLPFVANEVFAQIGDKEQSEIDYTFHATVSAFEIQDELITDLLRPSARGLTVSASAEEGVVIPGLYKEFAKDEMSMRKLFNDACENRASHSLPVGGSINTSHAMWEINLAQSEGFDDGKGTRRCHSRLLVLDLACVDSLTHQSETKSLESVTLHRSLISFVDCLQRLSTPTKAALAPFRTSKLTHYLSELLGGNAIVVGLGMIVGNEAPQSRKTMDIIGGIGDSVHFPIGGRELTDVLNGLLGKYRAMILQLQDEIQNGAPIGEKPPDISEKVVTELQRDLATAQLDRNIAKEDRQRIFEMMELLRAKYSTIIDDKTKQAQELIRAEEDKLSVARALVELKLEHSAKQEQAEKDKFEITSALLAAKNEIFDLDQQLLLSRTEGQALKDQSDDLERHVKKDLEELVQVKASLQEVRDQLQKETAKNLELGAELLTLLNQKSVLQHKVDDQQQKLDVLTVKLTSLDLEEKEMEKAKVAALDALRVKDDEIGRYKRATMEAEMEGKRLRLELDHLKQDSERNSVETEREKEAMQALLKETEARYKEAEKNRKEAPGEGGRNKKDEQAIAHAAAITKLEHKIRDLQRENKRAREDEDVIHNTKALLDEELAKVRQTYQSKLSELIISSDDGDAPAETDQVLADLIDFYKEKEMKSQQMCDDAVAGQKKLKIALQLLFDKYQNALDLIEENLVTASTGKGKDKQSAADANPLLSEAMFIGEAALKASSDQVNEADNFEAKVMRERLEIAEGSIAEEQERMQIMLNAFKRRLKNTEGKLAQSKKQCADLAAQIQQLVAAGPKERPPSAEAREREIQKHANADILKAMQEQFAKQIQILKEQQMKPAVDESVMLPSIEGGRASPGSSKPGTPGTVNSRMLGSGSVGSVNGRPVSKAESTRPESNMSGRPMPPTSANKNLNMTTPEHLSRPNSAKQGVSASNMNLEQALEYIIELENNSSLAMSTQLRNAEKRNANLSSRCSKLEEEMKAYQNYMRDTILQYKRQFQQMQMAMMKQSPRIGGKEQGQSGAGGGGKLPALS